MTTVIPVVGEITIVSMHYADDGVTWVKLFDNQAIGWLVDEDGFGAPMPIILDTLPPDLNDEASPQWGKFIDPYILIPDQGRQRFYDFLTWLATNNGMQRQLNGEGLFTPALINGFENWAAQHPDLVFQGDPPEPAEKPEQHKAPAAKEPKDEEPRRRGRPPNAGRS